MRPLRNGMVKEVCHMIYFFTNALPNILVLFVFNWDGVHGLHKEAQSPIPIQQVLMLITGIIRT